MLAGESNSQNIYSDLVSKKDEWIKADYLTRFHIIMKA